MKFIKKSGSFLERILGAQETKSYTPMTIEDERNIMAKEAESFEAKRVAQASKYPNIENHIFKTPEKPVYDDKAEVIGSATKVLGKLLKQLGADGNEIDAEEIQVTASHNDKIDNKLLTDEATVALKAKFATAKHPKTLRFVVSFNFNKDEKYTVAEKFYDEAGNEYQLSSEAILNYIENGDVEEMNKQASKTPLAVYNPETDSMEVIPTVESTERVASRLQTSGYEVKTEYIDRTRGSEFGRICYRVVGAMDIEKLRAEAALSDDEWITRAGEAQRTVKETSKDLSSADAWNNRSQEKASEFGGDYKHKELGDSNKKNWTDRTQEKGGHDNYGNPYNSEAKVLLMSQGSKKEEAKEAESKPEAKKVEAALQKLDIGDAVAKLSSLLNK